MYFTFKFYSCKSVTCNFVSFCLLETQLNEFTSYYEYFRFFSLLKYIFIYIKYACTVFMLRSRFTVFKMFISAPL